MGKKLDVPTLEEVTNALLKNRKGGRLEMAAYRRCKRDIKASKGKRFLYRYDHDRGAEVVRVFEGILHHSKGEWAGKPFHLEPWQVFIVLNLFGWVEKRTGLRRFRVAYIEIPRKSGKSTLAAGLAIYLAFLDKEPGSETYCAAVKRDQAKIVFGEARRMVLASKHLRRKLEVLTVNINHPKSGSKLEPLGRDADTLDGLNVHGVLIDEIHKHKNSELIDVLQSASGSRRQPMRVETTTAGYDRTTVCWHHHEYSTEVLKAKGKDDPTWFAYVACADPKDDYTKESTWRKANPNLGVSVKLAYIRAECERAKKMPSEQNVFRRMHLNQWTQQRERFIDMNVWNACGPRRDLADLAGQECWGGMDLAAVLDLTAFCLVFPREDGGFDPLWWFWMPEDEIEEKEQRTIGAQYRLWAKQGFLSLTPGNVTDYEFVRAQINELADRFQIREIAYDRWNASQLVTQLQQDGANMVPHGQGFMAMNPPIKQIERALASGTLYHGKNPVASWMAENVATLQDPTGNLRFDRRNKQEKIDGMVALAMAIGRWLVFTTEPAAPSSVYETRGLRMI